MLAKDHNGQLVYVPIPSILAVRELNGDCEVLVGAFWLRLETPMSDVVARLEKHRGS